MTTPVRPTSAPAAPARTVAADEPAARFRDLLAAEWIKFWSLRSTRWGVLLSAVIIIAMNVNAALADYRNWPTYPAQIKSQFFPDWAMNDAFTAGAAMVMMLSVGTIGALTIVSDYASGLARTTFAAVPARRSVVAAKAVVLTAVMLGYGAVVAAASFSSTQAILSMRDIGLSIGYPGALRAAAASALLAPVCALVGLGLGALIRHIAASVVATVVILLVVPALLDERRELAAKILHATPRGAWGRLTDPDSIINWASYPASVPVSWIVYVAWPLAAVVVAMLAVHRRDL